MNVLFVPRIVPELNDYMQASAPAIRTLARITGRSKERVFRLRFTIKKRSGHLLILLFSRYKHSSGLSREIRVIRAVGSGWDVAMRQFVKLLLEAKP